MVSRFVMLRLTALALILTNYYGLATRKTNDLVLGKPEAKIAYGIEATRTQFPFHAEIRLTRGEYDCVYGGSIISERHILTLAAISFVKKKTDISIHVYVGDIHEYKGENFAIAPHKIISHENFQLDPPKNDIAIIETPRKMIYTEFLQPIKLSFASPKTTFKGYVAFTPGFGHIKRRESSKNSPNLLYAEMQVLSKSQCMMHGVFSDDNQICARALNRKTPTYGDAGGALIQKISNPRIPKLIGILISELSSHERSSKPLVYTRVSSYIGWIEEKTNLAFD